MRFRKVLCLFFSIFLSCYIFGKGYSKEGYVDFSTERSTWFFKLDTQGNKKIFSDFYPPFDPTVKLKNMDPLVEYEMQEPYYFNKNGNLMIEIEDLAKIYSPYFEYYVKGKKLNIKYVRYDRTIIGNFGQRNTKLEYVKRVWETTIDMESGKGEITYLEYESFIGGRNKAFIEPKKVLVKERKDVDFSENFIEKDNKKIYIQADKLLKEFNIDSIVENGYFALQFKNIQFITINNPKIPSAKNIWRSGVKESKTEITWADYMDSVIENKREYGWFWKSFYMPSGKEFKDTDGKDIELKADRILPVAFYIPKTYSKENSKMTFILHGGTGNENASAYRMMDRDIYLSEYSEKYNQVLVFPNGWTQNPMWMHRQALYSFNKAYELAMNFYPVDKARVFLMGNSLGGRGTMDVAMRYPELFQAIAVTAPAWGVKEHSKWEQKRYSVSDIENLPVLVGVGTKDKTFSFRVEVGNKVNPGWITKDIVPFLKNATYITVEEGNHTYNWGSILDMIFIYFDDKLLGDTEVVERVKNIDIKAKNIDGSLMVSLEDLQKIYHGELEVYNISSYDKNIEDRIEYLTLIYNRNSFNFKLGEKKYRKNIERYKEDIGSRDKDIEFLENAPCLTKAPVLLEGKIYFPLKEMLQILGA